MEKQILFFHGGGGQEDYEADLKLADSLKVNLGAGYSVHYPPFQNDDTPDFGRRKQIGHEISVSADNLIVVGHSLGASMLLAYLSENEISKNIQGIFLIATPFWRGSEEWGDAAFRLQPNFAACLNKRLPVFFYHCLDDEIVPFKHLAHYKQHLPWATFRETPSGGHQLNNDLELLATDIKSL